MLLITHDTITVVAKLRPKQEHSEKEPLSRLPFSRDKYSTARHYASTIQAGSTIAALYLMFK